MGEIIESGERPKNFSRIIKKKQDQSVVEEVLRAFTKVKEQILDCKNSCF